MLKRYADVLSVPAYLRNVHVLAGAFEIRACRAGGEIVCAIYKDGHYLDSLSFMTVEIEPARGLTEDILVKVLMDDAESRLTGNLTFR